MKEFICILVCIFANAAIWFMWYCIGYIDGKKKAVETYDDLLDAYREYYKAVQPIIKKANEEANHGRTM